MSSPRGTSSTQSPPPDSQHPSQGTEPPSSGKFRHSPISTAAAHTPASNTLHSTSENRPAPGSYSVLENLPSNPEHGGPLERFVKEKTGSTEEAWSGGPRPDAGARGKGIGCEGLGAGVRRA